MAFPEHIDTLHSALIDSHPICLYSHARLHNVFLATGNLVQAFGPSSGSLNGIDEFCAPCVVLHNERRSTTEERFLLHLGNLP